MRAPSRALSVAAALGLLAACSRHDQSDMSRDARDAANSARAALAKATHDPEWKRAAADLKQLGRDAEKDLRKSAAEAKGATNAIVSDARRGARKADERQDQSDHHRSDNS